RAFRLEMSKQPNQGAIIMKTGEFSNAGFGKNYFAAATSLTETSQTGYGLRIRLDFCRKGRIAMCVSRRTCSPGDMLRARLAICGALGRASVNSGAANNGAQD